jgi:ABC-type branched-subunit amino acid transport system permease subunit
MIELTGVDAWIMLIDAGCVGALIGIIVTYFTFKELEK